MIVITGASRSIGKFLFESYFEREKVVGTFNSSLPDKDQLDYMYKVDISQYNQVEKFVETLRNDLINITLINCAGIIYSEFTHKSDPVKWKEVINVNLVGSYYMIRALLPFMREQNYGRIINLSSVAAQKGTPGISAYAASKSALWGLSKSVAQENGSKGITINNINLGYVNIGMGVEKVTETYKEFIISQIPTKEFCAPQEIFKTVEYIRNTSYLNGVSIDLSGGIV